MLPGKPDRIIVRLFCFDLARDGAGYKLESESEEDVKDFQHVMLVNRIDPNLKCNISYMRFDRYDRTMQVFDYYMLAVANQKTVNTIQPLTFKDSSILYVSEQ